MSSSPSAERKWKPKAVVLDASAVLAAIQQEEGAEVVFEYLPGALISAANLAEVVGKLTGDGIPATAIEAILQRLGLSVVPVDSETAFEAGLLVGTTSEHGLSLGDRICIACARRLSSPLLTTDRAWAALDVGVEILQAR